LIEKSTNAIPASIKRPIGLTLIGIIWGVTGIFNLLASAASINGDLGAIQVINYPTFDPWFRFAIPTEIILNASLFVFAAFQFIAIGGLWTRRRWSSKLALLLSFFIAAVYSALVALYYSAPASVGLTSSAPVGPAVAGFFWIYIYWVYLKKQRVREYLGVQDVSPSV